MDEKRIYSSQVLDRVMQILCCFNAESPELRLSELIKRTGMNRTTLYRLIEAMRAHGMIGLNNDTGTYHLGLKLFEFGALAIGRLEVGTVAKPVLEWLVEKTGETAHVCILDGSDVVYVARVESRHALRIPSAIGRRAPAYCTAIGKAILAYQSDSDIEAYLARTRLRAYTKRTLVHSEELMAELRLVRARGYSVDDQEIHENIRCVGAPVRDYSGRVVAAVSATGPTVRLFKEKIPTLAGQVVKAAGDISIQLGFNTVSSK